MQLFQLPVEIFLEAGTADAIGQAANMSANFGIRLGEADGHMAACAQTGDGSILEIAQGRQSVCLTAAQFG